MKLAEAREFYYFFSGKTSDIVRQLGFAAIAIIWIFHLSAEGKVSLPKELLLPLKLVVLGLGLDLCQYASSTAAWGIYQWWKERAGTSERKVFKAPGQINWPGIAFFCAKVILVAVAYWHLLTYLSHAIAFTP